MPRKDLLCAYSKEDYSDSHCLECILLLLFKEAKGIY
jgi:hypothetical protein